MLTVTAVVVVVTHQVAVPGFEVGETTQTGAEA